MSGKFDISFPVTTGIPFVERDLSRSNKGIKTSISIKKGEKSKFELFAYIFVWRVRSIP